VSIETALLAGCTAIRGGLGSSVASDRKLFGQNVAVKANTKSGKNNSEIITDLYKELFASAHDRLERWGKPFSHIPDVLLSSDELIEGGHTIATEVTMVGRSVQAGASTR
jgi:hypothetical protein